MAIPWPLTFFSSTRPLSTAPHHPYDRISLPAITFQPSQQPPFPLPNKSHPFITTSTKPHDCRLKITAAHFNISFQSLISPHYHWGIWTSLLTAGAFGALVNTLVALPTTNLSIIASEVPVYSIVLEYLLPVAIHLLLFRADLRRIMQSIRALLLIFLLGSGYGGVVGSCN